MTTPGRNEPCPCGSGKKYKNCCLNKDRARRIRETAWRREEQVTLEKLFAFGQRSEFHAQLVVASNLFWNGNYGLEGLNALDREEVRRFLEWYLYDYRLEQSTKRVVDLFVEEMGPTLLPGERERVAAWSDSYLSLYRITDPTEPGLLTVTDVFQQVVVGVGEDGLGRLGLAGDLILGRILRSSASPHFSWAAILLSAEIEPNLAQFIREAYRQYEATRTQASWSDFLSGSGYLFNHYLLRAAAEAGAARHAAGAYYDASRTVEELREAEKRLRAQAEQQAEQRWKEEQRQTEETGDTLRQTRGGILLPGYVQYKGSKELKQ